MTFHTQASFEVELGPKVDRATIKKILDSKFGRNIEVFEWQPKDEVRYAVLEGSQLKFYFNGQVSWDFDEDFDALCEAIGPLAIEAFEATLERDDGPSPAGDVITKYWGPDEGLVRNLAIRSDLAEAASAESRIILECGLNMAGPASAEVGFADNVSGVTFSLEGPDGSLEPVTSLCLAYVNDARLRTAMVEKARVLATLIAQAKGGVSVVECTKRSLLPASLPEEVENASTDESPARERR